MKLLVRRGGFLATVQDLGRKGTRASGVPAGGALDTHALRVANLLVGNDENAAGLETTLGTTRLRFEDDRVVAWCGGAFEVQAEGAGLLSGRAALLRAGGELSLAAPENGARAWLAISGGIDVPRVLGSRSTDLRSQFGGLEGRTLRDGDLLPLGPATAAAETLRKRLGKKRIAPWTSPNEWSNTKPSHGYLRYVRGAESAQFEPQALLGNSFTVMADSDRMGVRLEGPPLVRATDEELISAAVAPGTIQVPPSGHPILLLGDCQTIGGYPKIAHVITVDLPAAAQLGPGDAVRFAETSLAEAQLLLFEREQDMELFRLGLALHHS